jgi:ABC-2 type transport system ATP-binding protein
LREEGLAEHQTDTTAKNDTPVLEFRDLEKEFKLGVRLKRVHAVRGVTLTVSRGEIFGYLGPNGAGKTTTMKMAMGLIQPTAGSVRLFGESVDNQAVRHRVGYLPEHPYFYDYLTPVELLDFYGALFSIPKKVRRERIERLLNLVGLDHARDRTLRRFSKGMLQRAGIAQALINDPDLVVLDEPLSGLDPMGRKEVRDVIVALRQQGKTVFFSTHILQDIEMICDRVAIIDQGLIQRLGPLDEMLTGTGNTVDVVLQGVDVSLRSSLEPHILTLEELGANIRIEVEQARLNDALTVVSAAGAQVVDVSRRRDSLEELFVREAGGGQRG